ncbi:hypothetical protein HDU93_000843 [Gonapodya sp. JEL0774]|nr:hypothetical protein HDU93_000843 [Gonapodya sp. JEL0774]
MWTHDSIPGHTTDSFVLSSREAASRVDVVHTYTHKDLIRDVEETGVRIVGSVFIEASWTDYSKFGLASETAWVQDVADQTCNQVGTGIQSNIDMRQPRTSFETELRAHKAYPNFRGIRRRMTARGVDGSYPPGIDADPTVLDLPNVRANFEVLNNHGMCYDLWYRMKPATMQTTATKFFSIIRDNPEIKFVINHFLEPENVFSDEVMFRRWKEIMLDYAKFPNVFAKLSGLMKGLGGGFEKWPDPRKPFARELASSRFGDLVGFTVDKFGSERCMFGSNFPVDRLSATYGELLACYWIVCKRRGLSDVAMRNVFAETCRTVYKLPNPATS